MKTILFLILFLLTNYSFALQKECGCRKDSFINKNTTNKKYTIPINGNHFNALTPEYQFDDVVLKKDIVTLTYNSNKLDTPGKIIIDLRKYNH